uniref:Myosin heavy chain kinase B-like n=1 Tax=Nelumbo nucifera TaxID=4432 RepID=A0A822Z6V6_NELNU|nr:TPA_asm: hypothetical protein HUJ06_014900 [Nelumbo nucifera]
MRYENGGPVLVESNSLQRSKFGNILQTNPSMPTTSNEEDFSSHNSSSSAASPGYCDNQMSLEGSPYNTSPWNNQSTSPYAKSPWSRTSPLTPFDEKFPTNGLIGSLVREEGHIYSGFKSNSGLVKAIVISGQKIFTGHQDGKIRVWKVSAKNPSVHKRVGSLPTLKDFIKSSMNPNNYVEVKRHKNGLWIKHFDAISCLSMNEDQELMYSASWDKTFKVWRISDSKCLESINAHDDAVNSVVAGFEGLVFTGSADGTVKAWRRQLHGKGTKHALDKTLLKQECAVTALAVSTVTSVVYCGSSDGLVNFWEREKNLSHGGVLKGHKMAVLCLTAAGSLLISGSADKTICVWRREGGFHTCLSVLTGHNGPVKCLAVEHDPESTPDDPRWILYSGSLDKSVKVWRLYEQSPDLQQLAAMQQLNLPEGFIFPECFPSTRF